MEHGCEHAEASPIGKCAICDRTVCSECYREVFHTMICDLHESLEDESEWAVAGLYTDDSTLGERRYTLEDSGITSLVVESDGETSELYVPIEEKDDAFSTLSASGDGTNLCEECRIQFPEEEDSCPMCGAPPMDRSNEEDED